MLSLSFSELIDHYSSPADAGIFFLISFLVILAAVLIIALHVRIRERRRKNTQDFALHLRNRTAWTLERFAELMFSDTSILSFISAYVLLDWYVTDTTIRGVWDTYKDFILLGLIILSCVFNTFLDRIFVHLKKISHEEKAGIRLTSTVYMFIVFLYIRYIYVDNNYDSIIVYFISLMIGRFVFFDASWRDFKEAVKNAVTNFGLMALALLVTAFMAWYGFGTGYLLRIDSVVVNLMIAHLYMNVAIFILARTRFVNLLTPIPKSERARERQRKEERDDRKKDGGTGHTTRQDVFEESPRQERSRGLREGGESTRNAGGVRQNTWRSNRGYAGRRGTESEKRSSPEGMRGAAFHYQSEEQSPAYGSHPGDFSSNGAGPSMRSRGVPFADDDGNEVWLERPAYEEKGRTGKGEDRQEIERQEERTVPAGETKENGKNIKDDTWQQGKEEDTYPSGGGYPEDGYLDDDDEPGDYAGDYDRTGNDHTGEDLKEDTGSIRDDSGGAIKKDAPMGELLQSAGKGAEGWPDRPDGSKEPETPGRSKDNQERAHDKEQKDLKGPEEGESNNPEDERKERPSDTSFSDTSYLKYTPNYPQSESDELRASQEKEEGLRDAGPSGADEALYTDGDTDENTDEKDSGGSSEGYDNKKDARNGQKKRISSGPEKKAAKRRSRNFVDIGDEPDEVRWDGDDNGYFDV